MSVYFIFSHDVASGSDNITPCLVRPKRNICVVPVAYQQNLRQVGREIIKFCHNI